MANYSFGFQPLPTVEDGHVFEHCNFAQIELVDIFVGVSGLTFRNCNLVNCNVPVDATVDGCLTINKSMCAHLHPDMGLPVCVDNCSHVVAVDELEIDGVIVGTTYTYEDTVI